MSGNRQNFLMCVHHSNKISSEICAGGKSLRAMSTCLGLGSGSSHCQSLGWAFSHCPEWQNFQSWCRQLGMSTQHWERTESSLGHQERDWPENLGMWETFHPTLSLKEAQAANSEGRGLCFFLALTAMNPFLQVGGRPGLSHIKCSWNSRRGRNVWSIFTSGQQLSQQRSVWNKEALSSSSCSSVYLIIYAKVGN